MGLRPEDIESKEFLVALRGYDKDQVREFLGEVAAEMRRLTQAAASGSPGGADAQWEELRAHIASVMRAAADEASTIRLHAERDAQAIRNEARQHATENRPRRFWQ